MLNDLTDEEVLALAIEHLGENGEILSGFRDTPIPQLRKILGVLLADYKPPIKKLPEEQRIRNFEDFHRLWGATSPSPGYNKKAWIEIERQLLEAGAI